MRVKGTITLEQGVAAQHVLFSPAFERVGVMTKVSGSRKKAYSQDTMFIYGGKASSTSGEIK